MSKLEVVELTNKFDEITKCHVENYEEWGHGIGLDNYLEREKTLRTQYDSQGKIRYWALVLKDSNERETPVYVSSLEVLSRPSVEKSAEGVVTFKELHCIGSVFTPKRFRGKRYARTLLNAVTEKYTNGIDFKGTAITLFSDVGDYYEQFGYVTQTTRQLEMNNDSEAIDFDGVYERWQGTAEGTFTADPLTDKSASVVPVALRCQQIINDILKEKNGTKIISLLPQVDTIACFNWRAKYLSEKLQKSSNHIETYGYSLEGRSSVMFFVDHVASKIKILLFFLDDKDSNPLKTAAILLLHVIHHAHYHKLKNGVVLWEQDVPSALSLEQLMECMKEFVNANITTRPDSLPAIHGSWKWNFGGYSWF